MALVGDWREVPGQLGGVPGPIKDTIQHSSGDLWTLVANKYGTNRANTFKRCFACFVIVVVNLRKRCAWTLRSIVLLQFGLVTFRLAYWKDRKPFISLISGFSDMSLSFKTNIMYCLRPRIAQQIKEKYQILINMLLEISKFWKSHFLESLGKTGTRKSWGTVFEFLEKLECEINIFQKHELEVSENLE